MSGETQSNESGWTVDTSRYDLISQLEDMRRMLDERYATQVKAVDAAFLAQQTAMQTALTAAERAVQTALLSAEKAVAKADLANEKRFEGVNEFRQTLTDQANTFSTRVEADAIHRRTDDRISDLSARMDRNEGSQAGSRYALGIMLALATIIISLVVVVATVVAR